MGDGQLLKHYASFYGPEAGPWNVSPECLYVEYRMRAFVKAILDGRLAGAARVRVCNVGIGQGDWDLFLSYTLGERGDLTSVEVSAECCELFRARLAAQEHPHPVHVVNEDVTCTSLPPEAFDLVTVVGSAVEESGEEYRMLDACLALVRPGGILVYSDFTKYRPLTAFHRYAASRPVDVLDCDDASDHAVPFYIVSVAKRRAADGGES
ncbi:MAG: class I SAM-dependent methyltransferase [Candidatus Hydrogenedentes bacterium]|nr:class I SAM-dependent methyltransferase [Candidatus Hydrogenedentota bacterium]